VQINKGEQMVKKGDWGDKIKTASPLELVIIAYEGAINFLKEADRHMNNKEHRKAGLSIVKARKIIQELRGALDTDVEEISGNLFSLYRTMDAMLMRAAADKDSQRIEQVIKMLSSLKESWAGISDLPAAKAR